MLDEYTPSENIEIKVFFESNDGKFCCFSEVHLISFKEHHTKRISGIINLLIVNQNIISNLPLIPKNMIIIASDEHKPLFYTKFYDIKFEEIECDAYISYTTLEQKIRFTASSFTPWTSVCENTSCKIIEEEPALKRLRSYK